MDKQRIKNTHAALIQAYNSIETAPDMIQQGLTLSDYDALYISLQDIRNQGYTDTIYSAVKAFLERHGLTAAERGVGWRLTV
jgi:hypothetical protein